MYRLIMNATCKRPDVDTFFQHILIQTAFTTVLNVRYNFSLIALNAQKHAHNAITINSKQRMANQSQPSTTGRSG